MRSKDGRTLKTIDWFREKVFVEGRTVRAVVMSACDYADLRKHGGPEFAPTEDRALWILGLMGHVRGAEVRIARGMRPGEARVVTDGGSAAWCDLHERFACGDPACVVAEVHES